MKKIWTVLGVIILTLLMAGCSTSMEKDAKKAAELACEYMEYMDEGDFESAQAMETNELLAFQDMIENKYDFNDAEFVKEWEKNLAKALEKLDCDVTINDLR